MSFLSLQSSNLFTYLPFKNLILWLFLLASPYPPQCGLKSEFSRHVGMMQQVSSPIPPSPSCPSLSLYIWLVLPSFPILSQIPILFQSSNTGSYFFLYNRSFLPFLQESLEIIPVGDWMGGGTRESASLSNRAGLIESSFDEIVLKIKTTTSLTVCPISTSTILLY